MNKNSPLNQRYVCPIGADGIHAEHEVREATAVWITEYNTIRSHESLGDVPPIEFLNQRGHAGTSTYSWP